MSEIKNKIEAILFVAGDMIDIKDLAANGLNEDVSEIRKQTAILADEYDERNAGIKIIWVKDMVQMSSREDYAQEISEVLAPLKVTSLTQSAIETLAIIAYKQPVTRTEVAEIRGVRSDYSINMLMQRGLIAEAGKKDALGSPMMFATTELFLREFNLNTIADMPSVEDIEVVNSEDADENFEDKASENENIEE